MFAPANILGIYLKIPKYSRLYSEGALRSYSRKLPAERRELPARFSTKIARFPWKSAGDRSFPADFKGNPLKPTSQNGQTGSRTRVARDGAQRGSRCATGAGARAAVPSRLALDGAGPAWRSGWLPAFLRKFSEICSKKRGQNQKFQKKSSRIFENF